MSMYDIISGQQFVNNTRGLLDSTLATLQNKRQMQEHQQLSQMRNQQITQTNNEITQWQREAQMRDLERQTTVKKSELALKNMDEKNELAMQSARSQGLVDLDQGHRAGREMLFDARGDKNAWNLALNNMDKAGVMGAEQIENLRGKWNVDDSGFQQLLNEQYMDYEAWLALRKESISASGQSNKRLTLHTADIAKVLQHTEIPAADAFDIASQSGVTAQRLMDYGVNIGDTEVARMASEIYAEDKEKWSREAPDAGFFGGVSDAVFGSTWNSQPDTENIMREVERRLLGAPKQEVDDALPKGMTEDKIQWLLGKPTNQGKTRQDIIDAINANQ